MPIASHYIRRGLSLRRDFARHASDRGYLTILDKVRVLPDKEGGKGTWQRISRRRMDQSRNFASNVAPPLCPFPPPVCSPTIPITASLRIGGVRGISYPRRPTPHLASAPKTPRSRGASPEGLRCNSCPDQSASALPAGKTRYITVSRATS